MFDGLYSGLALRLLLNVIVGIMLGTGFSAAGVLNVTISSISKTCVGDKPTISVVLSNTNTTYGINGIKGTIVISDGSTPVVQDSIGTHTLAPSGSKQVEIVSQWTAPEPANKTYSVKLTAKGLDNINGTQTAENTFTVCPGAACPDRPTASGDVIYLGTGNSGSISYSTPKESCCFRIKVTKVSGRTDAVTVSPDTWTVVSTAGTQVAVTIDKVKNNGQTTVVRVDWRSCDDKSAGSDYVLVREGQAPTASNHTTPPPPVSGAQCPNSGYDSDPVITATREVIVSAPVDVITNADIGVSLERDYLSSLQTIRPKVHDFGPGWSHPFDWTLVSGDGEAYILGPLGLNIRFRQADGKWVLDWPTTGSYQLSRPNNNTWMLLDRAADRLYEFDSAGRLLSIGNTAGYKNTVTWTGAWITGISTPTGKGLTFTRDSVGRIVSASNGRTTTLYDYTNGLLTRATDGLGNATTYTYAPGTSLLTKWTTPEGRTPMIVTYDSEGKVQTQDFGGFLVNFSQVGTTTSITLPGGKTTRHTHDADARLTSLTRAGGGTATFVYDAAGNRSEITDMGGGKTVRTFIDGLPTSVRYPDNTGYTINYRNRTVNDLDIADIESIEVVNGLTTSIIPVTDMVKQIIRSDGYSAELTYQPLTSKPVHVRSAGVDNSYEYDLDGMLKRLTMFDGSSYTYAYNTDNTLKEITSSTGSPMTIQTNTLGAVTGWQWGTQHVQYAYDKDGLLSAITDGENRITSFSYNLQGMLEKITKPGGALTNYTWTGPYLSGIDFGNGRSYQVNRDSDMRPNTIVGPNDLSYSAKYNYEGIPTSFIMPGIPAINIISDNMGRRTQVITPSGLATNYTWTNSGSLGEIQLPTGLSYSYGQRNNNKTVDITRNGLPWLSYTMEYDKMRSVDLTMTDAEDNTWRISSFSAGYAEYTTPSGKKMVVQYDALGKVKKVTWPDESTDTYEYSQNRLTKVTVGGEANTFTYDLSGLMNSMNGAPIGRDQAGRITDAGNIHKTYNADGQVTQIDVNNKRLASYEYTNGRPTAVTDFLGGRTEMRYNDMGLKSGYIYPDLSTLNYVYTADGKIQRIEDSGGWWMEYAYTNGRVSSVTRSDNVNLDQAFSDFTVNYTQDNLVEGAQYDSRFRLQGAPSLGITNIKYGQSGISSFTRDGKDFSIIYNAFGKIDSIKNNAETVKFYFDPYSHTPAAISYKIANSDYAFLTFPYAESNYQVCDVTKLDGKYLIDDGNGNIVAVRNKDGTYDEPLWYTPFGEKIGAQQYPLGFGGSNGIVTMGGLHLTLDGRQTHMPELSDEFQGAFEKKFGFGKVGGDEPVPIDVSGHVDMESERAIFQEELMAVLRMQSSSALDMLKREGLKIAHPLNDVEDHFPFMSAEYTPPATSVLKWEGFRIARASTEEDKYHNSYVSDFQFAEQSNNDAGRKYFLDYARTHGRLFDAVFNPFFDYKEFLNRKVWGSSTGGYLNPIIQLGCAEFLVDPNELLADFFFGDGPPVTAPPTIKSTPAPPLHVTPPLTTTPNKK